MTLATGTFTVTLTPLPAMEQPDDITLGRLAIAKTYTGDMAGSGRGEMLSAVTLTKGSAGYVAIEHVEATLEGRNGCFVLQHSGSMERGAQSLNIHVVPDSGTLQLAGISGNCKIIIAEGKHFYEFEYNLPALA